MHAALTNAVYAVRGPDNATLAKTLVLRNSKVGGRVASLTQVAKNLRIYLDLLNFKDSSSYTFDGLPLILDRVSIVRVSCTQIIDHTVCLDSKFGIIIDSCDRYPTMLTSSNLF